MRRTIVRMAVAALLVALGWAAGRAQTAQPDFEIVVSGPAGETVVECRRGCALAWVERGVHPNSEPTGTFTFRCAGPSVTRCSSARIGGWVRPGD